MIVPIVGFSDQGGKKVVDMIKCRDGHGAEFRRPAKLRSYLKITLLPGEILYDLKVLSGSRG